MSRHRENDVWQSPDSTWSIGFYEVTRPAEDEWDQEFGPDFSWVSTGHPTAQAAIQSWDGANPGSHMEYSLANSTAAEIARRDDMAAELEDRIIAEYGTTASRWGNGPYSGPSRRNDPASLVRRATAAFEHLREIDAAEHHYRINGYANTVEHQRREAADRLADLKTRALGTGAMSLRALARLEADDRAERLKDLRKLKARDADQQAGRRSPGSGHRPAPGRAEALRALDAAIAELEQPVPPRGGPAARAGTPTTPADQGRDVIGRFATAARPPADIADIPLPEQDPWGPPD